MPTRLCSEPSCPEPAHYRGRCATHARTNERTVKRAGLRIYSTSKWQNTRRRYLFLHPLCECGCGRISEDVHHRVDLDDDGDPWAFSNLEALSHSCHSRTTRQRQVQATTT